MQTSDSNQKKENLYLNAFKLLLKKVILKISRQWELQKNL
jgi:hypothetical protein